MRLTRHLTEIKMTKKTEFYGTSNTFGDEWETKFKVGKWEYEVFLTRMYDEWSLVFKLSDDDLYNINRETGKWEEFGLTGFGNPIQVFRGVLQALKKWYKDEGHKAKKLTFAVQGEEKQNPFERDKEVKKRLKVYKRGIPAIEKITKMKFTGIDKLQPDIYVFNFEKKE